MPTLRCPTNLVGTLLFRAPLLLMLLLLLCFDLVWNMRVNPERIAARLRIEEEIEMDKILSRNRRQLGVTPKEISISVTAPLFSSRLFSYGPDVNDQELPRSLDVGKKLSLTYPINFYGQEQYTVYILSNGGIGFEPTSRTYKTNILSNNIPIIAPFWNRNDLRNGGHVFYREEKAGRVLERGQSEIRYQYDLTVKVKSCLLVTWEKMQPHGAAALPDDNTNTFQAALFITTNGTFANFIYKNIGWTQGAEAGFNKGDGSNYYALPTSGTGNVMYLEEYGNTGIPGEWMFVMNDERVERCKSGVKGDTCDEECANGEWGADCMKCCHCASGSCNSVTGECAKGQCAECWTGAPSCQIKKDQCSTATNIHCPHNAVTFVDYDRCGEPVPRCQCLAGYTGVGNQECIDINECAESNTCHPNAICTNTPGGFFCQCSEGYSGDGINECVSSFFYPYNGHQTLPKSRGAKVLWQMKSPIVVFGEPRNHFTISTNGIIAIESDAKLKADTPLEDMGIHGIAPFFASIDTTKRGDVFVDESTDSDVLTRATRIVRENYHDGSFVATNTLTVTYINVTDGRSNKGNSFQVLLISGTNKKKANLTFAQLLYKKLPWSSRAEAGIMSYDNENSILLPGSGTEGIEQLSQLSNIKVPGQWLYRIDTPVIPPCASVNLQPPYCANEKPVSNSKQSLTQHPVLAATTLQPKLTDFSTSSQLAANTNSFAAPKINHSREGIFEIPGPKIIQPVLIGTLPTHITYKSSILPVTSTFNPTRRTTTTEATFTVSTEARSKYIKKVFTPHVPIVSIDSHDIEDIPPDAFDVTLPAVVTVIPQVETPKASLNKDEISNKPDIEANSNTKIHEEKLYSADENQSEANASSNVPYLVEKSDDINTNSNSDNEEATIYATTSNVSIEEANDVVQQVSSTSINNVHQPEKPLYVFTTPTPKRTLPAKPRLITAGVATTAGANSPYDNHNSKVQVSSSNLAVIIPTAIIAVWLLLLAIIALFCCCRRRRAEREFRDLYMPNHQVRPLSTSYNIRKNSKNYDATYDDHLEKAARLSSEMNSYAQ